MCHERRTSSACTVLSICRDTLDTFARDIAGSIDIGVMADVACATSSGAHDCFWHCCGHGTVDSVEVEWTAVWVCVFSCWKMVRCVYALFS